MVFVDTNVLVYWREAGVPEKQRAAKEWLKVLWRERSGRVSPQVLHEYYTTVTDKLKPGLDRTRARRDVRRLLPWLWTGKESVLLQGAWELQDRYRLSWWDALIAGAARASDCEILLSEDFQDGQDLGGVQIVNPFLHGPESLRERAQPPSATAPPESPRDPSRKPVPPTPSHSG